MYRVFSAKAASQAPRGEFLSTGEFQRFQQLNVKVYTTRKYKNIAAGQRRVSLIIDDLKTRDPWAPRAIKIHGVAEVVERKGRMGPGSYLAITPTVSWSWGIEELQVRQGKVGHNKIIWT
jgi:pyridoxamine 5'-phosphate oxidase family protein